MTLLRILVVGYVCLCAAPAFAIPVANVPNPKTTQGLWVEDQAQILGPDYTQLVNAIAQQVHDVLGAEMAVVTVDNLDGETIEHYANELFTRYGVGKSGKDNGILILVARDDRKTRIEVGYGLEAIMNDAKAGRILDESAVPWFHDNQFGRGMVEASRALALALAEGVGATLTIADPATWPAQPAVTFQKAPLRRGIFLQVVIITAFLFSIPAIILLLWYAVRFFTYKSRVGKKRALIHNDAFEASLLFMGPIAAGMIGYSEGNVWVGIAAAPIPIAMWGVVRLCHRQLKKRIPHYIKSCPECRVGMEIMGEVSSHLSDTQRAEMSAKKRDFEVWHCTACGREIVMDVELPQDGRDGRPRAPGGSGSSSSGFGGGRSGGGGASRGF